MNPTGGFVAIKEVALTNMTKEQIVSIQKEINLLNKLNHPNIVKYIGKSLSPENDADSIYSENYLHIILEYMENGSLADVVRKFGPLSESIIAIYMKQV